MYYDVTNILRMNRSLNLIDNKDESDCIEMSLNRIENKKKERERVAKLHFFGFCMVRSKISRTKGKKSNKESISSTCW